MNAQRDKSDEQQRDEQQRWENFMLQAEANSWSRFNNFLVFTSILMLAWAAIFTVTSELKRDIVLVAISLFGFVSAVAWSLLGFNSRRYQTFYMGQARDAGSPMAMGTLFVRRKLLRQIGSFQILIITPLAVSCLYVCYLYMVLMSHFEWMKSWCVAVLTAVAVIIGLCVFYKWLKRQDELLNVNQKEYMLAQKQDDNPATPTTTPTSEAASTTIPAPPENS
jgi:hypothetical protein